MGKLIVGGRLGGRSLLGLSVHAAKEGAALDFSGVPDFSSCSTQEIVDATRKIFDQAAYLNAGGRSSGKATLHNAFVNRVREGKRKLSADIAKHSHVQNMPLVSSVNHVTFHTQAGPQLLNFLCDWSPTIHKPVDLNSFKFPV